MPYKPQMGPLGMPQYQARPMAMQPKQPGIGEQLATNAAGKLATDQIAKLGLQAAGTAAAGPLGGAVAGAASDLAGPLAKKLVGGLFNKGGPVYLWGGGDFGLDWKSGINSPEIFENYSDYGSMTADDLNRLQILEDEYQEGEGITGDDYIDSQYGKLLNRYNEWKANKKAEVPDATEEELQQAFEAEVKKAKPAPIDRAVGGSRGVSGTWNNIPLGSIGDWKLSTSGGLQGDMKMNDGTKQKGGWNASINATTPTGFLNDIFGGNTKKALADSASIYNESVAKDIAEENKGSSAYWKSLGYSDDEAMDKIMEHLGMSDGGNVKPKKSIWGSIKDKVVNDFTKRKTWHSGKKDKQKPTYKAMGGMTPGPLGFSDVKELGRGQDVSKVVYKKKGGDVEDTIEMNYHTPLSYQQTKGE